MPLPLDRQQAVLEGDLHLVGLDAGKLDRHQVGVLAFGYVDRRPQAAGVVPLVNCWPGRQPCPLVARSISSCAARRSSNRSQPVMTVISFSLASGRSEGPADPEEHRSGEHYSVPSYTVHFIVNSVHSQTRSTEAGMASQRQAAGDDAATGPLWFNPPGSEESRRRALTRDRVVAEALAIISAHGAATLSMRTLATRLGVVPAALYRHVTTRISCTTSSSTVSWPRSTARPTPPSPGPDRSARSRTGCGPSSKTTPASPPCSRPATPSAPHPSLWPGVPRPAARRRPARPPGRLGLSADLRLHPRLRAQRPHLTRRAARPGHRHQTRTARLPALPARHPVPGTDRPRRIRLGRRPRPAVHRQPRHPRRRPAGSSPMTALALRLKVSRPA